ncbi:MAG: hypothetical protein PHC92_09610 [Syntrophomonadaceae bacterium]|nr:hypothetical protein [Syntrophomonadaceae bacterium]
MTEDIAFEEIEMGDGMFMMLYKMQDLQGNIAYSDVIMFETVNGESTTSTGFTKQNYSLYVMWQRY